MRYIKPDYYDKFQCTADKCPDTCCAGWQIVIDEASLEKYDEMTGSFGNRVHNSIDWEEGCFFQYEGRCAFLNEQNLCDLQKQMGEESLCDTCRNYPRHTEEYEGLRELSLSLSCPAAAEMILSQQGMPRFVITEDDRGDELEDEFEDFDLLLFTQLEDARKAVFDSLKSEKAPKIESGSHKENGFYQGLDRAQITLQDKMQKCMEMAEKMQKCVEEGRYFEIEECVRQFCDKQSSTAIEAAPNAADAKAYKTEGVGNDGAGTDPYEQKISLYRTMKQLERLREEWTDLLSEMERILYDGGRENYLRIQKDFHAWLEHVPERKACWENVGLQLFVFFVYTYFCGAVYDDWIYSKMALAVSSVEFIRELLMARWKKNGEIFFADYAELSYRYAREIEHSDLNLNTLEETFMEHCCLPGIPPHI